MLCASILHARWLASPDHGSPAGVITFMACAIPLRLGLLAGMLCATKPYARARHGNATLPRLVRGPPVSRSTSRPTEHRWPSRYARELALRYLALEISEKKKAGGSSKTPGRGINASVEMSALDRRFVDALHGAFGPRRRRHVHHRADNDQAGVPSHDQLVVSPE